MNDITEEVTILNTANHNGGGNPHNQYVLKFVYSSFLI